MPRGSWYLRRQAGGWGWGKLTSEKLQSQARTCAMLWFPQLLYTRCQLTAYPVLLLASYTHPTSRGSPHASPPSSLFLGPL